MPIGLRGVCRRRHFTVGECLGFHVEIDFSIDMGRIQGDMTEPSSDRINIDPSPHQMDRGGVPLMPRAALTA